MDRDGVFFWLWFIVPIRGSTGGLQCGLFCACVFVYVCQSLEHILLRVGRNYARVRGWGAEKVLERTTRTNCSDLCAQRNVHTASFFPFIFHFIVCSLEISETATVSFTSCNMKRHHCLATAQAKLSLHPWKRGQGRVAWLREPCLLVPSAQMFQPVQPAMVSAGVSQSKKLLFLCFFRA